MIDVCKEAGRPGWAGAERTLNWSHRKLAHSGCALVATPSTWAVPLSEMGAAIMFGVVEF